MTAADAFAAYSAAQFVPVRNMVAANIHDHSAAEDIAQNAFVSAWQHWDKFEDRGDGGRAWMFLIARRKMMDWMRRKARRDLSLDNGWAAQRDRDGEMRDHYDRTLADDTAEDEDAIVARLDAASALANVRRELTKCPELLAWASGTSYAEIAEQRGITEGYARVRVHRQRQRLAAATG